MKKYILGLIAWLCVTFHIKAVDNLRLPDMRSMGMGGNGVTQSMLFNPSLVALSTNKTIHLAYYNRYLMKELGTAAIAFQYPNELLSVGVNIFSFGYDAYRETLFRLALGKRLGEKWRLGVSVQYALLQTELSDGQQSRLSTDIGAVFSPVDKLLIGMLITDIPSFFMGNKEVEIKDFKSYSVQIGFQWEVINQLLIAGYLGTCKEDILTGGMGIEYTAFNTFRIRAGIKAPPLLPSLGIGYTFSSFTVDVATLWHPILGMSTGVGLSFSF